MGGLKPCRVWAWTKGKGGFVEPSFHIQAVAIFTLFNYRFEGSERIG